MFNIIFFSTDKRETFIKPGFLGAETWIPLGSILSNLLAIESDKDIDCFLEKYGCNGPDLLNIRQYDTMTGLVVKSKTQNHYSTVRNEKEHLLWALNKYISLTKQYPLSKKKYSKGGAFNLKSQQDELPNLILHPDTFDLMKDSINYMKIGDIFGEHSLGRLSQIGIRLTSVAQNKKRKINEVASVFNQYDEKLPSVHSTRSEEYISMGFAYKFSANDFLTIPWLEFIEIIKEKAFIEICDTCKCYFFDALRETKRFCSNCGPQSLDINQRTEDEKNRKNVLQNIRRNKPSDIELKKYMEQRGLSEDLLAGFKPRKRRKKESE